MLTLFFPATPVKSYKGHRNTKNFVGLTCEQPKNDYFACGSEDNNVYVYYRNSEKPIARHWFGERTPAKIRGLAHLESSRINNNSNLSLNEIVREYSATDLADNSQNDSQNTTQNSQNTENSNNNNTENNDITNTTADNSNVSLNAANNLLPPRSFNQNPANLPAIRGDDFISAVCWKKNSGVIAAANSQGMVKLQFMLKTLLKF